MNPNDILRDVMVDRANRRPDAAEILEAVHSRADGHRLAWRHSVTVIGAACAVAAIAVGTAGLAHRASGHLSTPAGAGPITTAAEPDLSTPTAARSRTPYSGSATVTPSARRPWQPTSRPYSTIAAGWLPGQARQVDALNWPGFEQRDYDVVVDGTHMDVIVYLEDGISLPSQTEAGPADRDIMINRHPAREFIADRATIVAVDLGNGKIAFAGPSVQATTPQVTSQRITEIAVRVATNIEFDRHDRIPGS
jgi:hypothetical protein